jgi:uncharacterized NAD(P)/FAD-binding protein YdhS
MRMETSRHSLGVTRLTEGVGYFREVFFPHAERFETLFSTPDKFEGAGLLATRLSDEIREHGYWGGMRDRIPASQTDAMDADTAVATRPEPGRRVIVPGVGNAALIRSGQDWGETQGEERQLYLSDIEPVLGAGMDFLEQKGDAVGCFYNAITLAVIGMGATGASFFVQMIDELTTLTGLIEPKDLSKFTFVLVDAKSQLGNGTPYSYERNAPSSILNVKAAAMSIRAKESTDFVKYVEELLKTRQLEKELSVAGAQGLTATDVNPEAFYPRVLFGQYMNHRVQQAIATAKQAGIKVIELPNTLVSDIGTMDEKTGLMTLKFQNANPGDKNPAPADVQVTHIFQATGHWDEPDKFQTNDPTLNISAKQSRIIQYPVGYDRLRNEGVFEGPADIAVMGSGLSAIDAAFAVLLHPDVGTLKWQGMTPTYIPKQPEGKRITVTCYSRRGVWPKVRPDFTEPFVGSYTSPGKYEEIRHLMNNDKPLSLEACIKLLDMEMAKAYDRPVAIPKRSPGQSEAEYAKVVSLFRVPADQKQPLASVEYLFDPLGLNDKHPERKKDPADPFKLVEADIMFADNGDYASTPEQPNVRWYEVIHNLFPVLTRAYRGFTPEERERFDKDYNTNFLWAFAPMTKRSALTIVALHKAGVLNLHRVAPPTSTDKTPNPTVVREGANVKSVTWKYIDYDRTVKTKSHPFMAVTTGLSANITQDISPLTQNQLKSGGYTNYDLTMASGLQKREGSIFLADDDTYEILDQKGHHSPARRGVGFFAHSNIWAIQAVPAVVPHAAKAVRLYVAEFAARVNGDPLKAVLHQTSYDPAQDPRVALQHAKL